MSVGYLQHSFDLFNVEHLDLVAAAGARYERLVIGVYDDEQVLVRTGRPPVVPLRERLEIVASVRGVHEVVVHTVGTDVSGMDVLVSEEDVDGWPIAVTALPSARTSSSDVLRQALRPLGREAVA